MEEVNEFIGRLKDYIETSINKKIALSQDISAILNSNTNGYRSLGINQTFQYNTAGFSQGSFGDGSSGGPGVGP